MTNGHKIMIVWRVAMATAIALFVAVLAGWVAEPMSVAVAIVAVPLCIIDPTPRFGERRGYR